MQDVLNVKQERRRVTTKPHLHEDEYTKPTFPDIINLKGYDSETIAKMLAAAQALSDRKTTGIAMKNKKFKKIKWWANPAWYSLAGFLIAQLVTGVFWLATLNGKVTELQHLMEKQHETNKEISKTAQDVNAIKTDITWIRSYMEKKK